MKPCRKYKEQIAAAIVAGDLSGDLKHHVENCPACRAYANEMQEVCGEHQRRAEALPEVEITRGVHARVREAIRQTAEGPCCGFKVRPSLRRLLQGLGVAAAATIIIAFWIQRSPSPTGLPPSTAEVTTRGSQITKWSEPTFAAYHRRLARSVEELEASLQVTGGANGSEVLKVSSEFDNLP